MNASIFQLDLVSGEVSLLRSERPPLFGLRVYDAQSQLGKVTLTLKKSYKMTRFSSFFNILLNNGWNLSYSLLIYVCKLECKLNWSQHRGF